ncbi:MAG TPA: DUF3575 domain-containing protein [Bacteroidales bacterium]|jgi:hypothetical protein|nr:DUF3575 domain-containing protein [Bacteroidales bacterium]HOU98145.1 DUF3575 domain-containing protein [Bacteroidales bacterium]
MKSRFILILILLYHSINIYSQKAIFHHNKNILKINPLGGVASAIPLSIERFFINNYFSLGGSYTYISNKSGSGQSTYNNDGFVIMPQLRHYFYNDSVSHVSIYIGGYYDYEEHYNKTLDRYSNAINGTAKGKGGGLLFGSQWFLKNGFVFDFYIGPGFIEYTRNNNYDNNVAKGGFLVSFTGPKNTGTKVKLGFSLGYSF